ncbi:MAG: hypothetical protein H7267_10050 [Sandarakinorhabdus sp.]|nr:hypothetical protein [Sandarakinorhabdus sp.]
MTLITETNDFDLVKQDPAAWYRLPQAVLDDTNLSSAEKYSLLDVWAHDLADRSNAADEGMVADAAALADSDVRMQDRVAEAQAMLSDMAATPDTLSLAARIWRRITGADQSAKPVKVKE